MQEIKQEIGKGSVGIWWIGQGGFIFKSSDGKIIIADPYLSNSVEKEVGLKRLVEIPVEPESLIADLLLCTHDHLDHSDPDTLKNIDLKKIKRIAGPGSVYRKCRSFNLPENKMSIIERGEEKSYGGIKARAIFAKHTEDSVGYALDLNGVRIYISGDTEYDDKLTRLADAPPDIMIICINGKWGNMNFNEAAALTAEINPGLVIPTHYGMFAENTTDPTKFIQALKTLKYKDEVKILNHKELFIYKKGNS